MTRARQTKSSAQLPAGYAAEGEETTAPLVADLIDSWVENQSAWGADPSTTRNRTTVARVIRRCLAEADVHTVADLDDEQNVLAFFHVLRDVAQSGKTPTEGGLGRTERTVSRHYAEVGTLFEKVGVKPEWVGHLKTARRDVMRGANIASSKQRATTMEDVQALVLVLADLEVQVAAGERVFIRDRHPWTLRLVHAVRSLIHVCWDVGLRMSEVTSIHLADVDTRRGRVLYHRIKGKDRPEEAHAALSQQAIAAVEAWMSVRLEGLKGKTLEKARANPLLWNMSRDNLERSLKFACRKAGIPEVNGRHGVHGFRRNVATAMHLDGENPADIAGHLGHREVATYQANYLDADLVDDSALEAHSRHVLNHSLNIDAMMKAAPVKWDGGLGLWRGNTSRSITHTEKRDGEKIWATLSRVRASDLPEKFWSVEQAASPLTLAEAVALIEENGWEQSVTTIIGQEPVAQDNPHRHGGRFELEDGTVLWTHGPTMRHTDQNTWTPAGIEQVIDGKHQVIEAECLVLDLVTSRPETPPAGETVSLSMGGFATAFRQPGSTSVSAVRLSLDDGTRWAFGPGWDAWIECARRELNSGSGVGNAG